MLGTDRMAECDSSMYITFSQIAAHFVDFVMKLMMNEIAMIETKEMIQTVCNDCLLDTIQFEFQRVQN
jgi:hypothetical protein